MQHPRPDRRPWPLGQAGNFAIEKCAVDLAALVSDLMTMEIGRSDLRLEVDPVTITIQKAALEIILRNLISNAIKHNDHADGYIQVRYSCEGDNHVISVIDDGPGIPPEFQAKAKKLFQTLKSRDTVEGSGLGLAMVERTMLRYGGSFEIRSQGRGSTMVLHWPK